MYGSFRSDASRWHFDNRLSQTSSASERPASPSSKKPSSRSLSPALIRSTISAAPKAHTTPTRACSLGPMKRLSISEASFLTAVENAPPTKPPRTAPGGPPSSPIAAPTAPLMEGSATCSPLFMRRKRLRACAASSATAGRCSEPSGTEAEGTGYQFSVGGALTTRTTLTRSAHGCAVIQCSRAHASTSWSGSCSTSAVSSQSAHCATSAPSNRPQGDLTDRSSHGGAVMAARRTADHRPIERTQQPFQSRQRALYGVP